jgi:hypothetical protein
MCNNFVLDIEIVMYACKNRFYYCISVASNGLKKQHIHSCLNNCISKIILFICMGQNNVYNAVFTDKLFTPEKVTFLSERAVIETYSAQ